MVCAFVSCFVKPRLENYKYSNSKSLEYSPFYAVCICRLAVAWYKFSSHSSQSRENFQIHLDSSLTLLTSNVPNPYLPSADIPLEASEHHPDHPNKDSLLPPLRWCSRAGTPGHSWRAWFALPESHHKRPLCSSPGSSSAIELHIVFLVEKSWKSHTAQKVPLHSFLPSHLLRCTSLWLTASILAPMKPKGCGSELCRARSKQL